VGSDGSPAGGLRWLRWGAGTAVAQMLRWAAQAPLGGQVDRWGTYRWAGGPPSPELGYVAWAQVASGRSPFWVCLGG